MPNDEKKPYTRYKSSRIKLRNKPLKVGSPEPVESQPQLPDEPREPSGFEQERSRGGWGKKIFIVFLLLLALALMALVFSYWMLDRAVRASNDRVPADVLQILKKPAGGMMSTPVNILFLGSDKRPGDTARADTILIMRVDGQNNSIAQLSIPRDTLADIPGYGEGKINSAYAYGGPALQIQAVEELTGVPVHHYVELDFNGFPGIVDSLGGVDINVPKTIDSQYPQGLAWTQVHFDAGPQKMSGERALTFVRVRYSDDDFQRMGRQQLFMEALQKKMTSPVNMAKMPLLAPGIVENITTDLSTNELIELGWIKFRTPVESNRKYVLVGSGSNIDGGSYVVLDESASQAMIRDFLAGR